jgi:hypothetical protein
MREKISQGLYALTAHAEEEMHNDNLVEEDIEHAICNGAIVQTARDRLSRRKYTVEGTAQNGRTTRAICRFSDSGRYLVIITVYTLDD